MTEPLSYATGAVVSHDGTTIGYRRVGRGPGLIAVHGGGQAAQNLMRLAEALADEFTVYVPDRRGRGLSGPPGENYGLKAECEDLEALRAATGATYLFGLSSGALIALQYTALAGAAMHKTALYEPPLSINHSTPTAWVDRFDTEVAEGRLGSAMFTAIRGTQTAPPAFRLLPRFLLATALNHVAGAGRDEQRRDSDSGYGKPSARRAGLRLLLWPARRLATRKTPPHNSAAQTADVPLRDLVPTMHYDVQLVLESEGTLEGFSEISAEVLLLGGSRSASYLKKTLDTLGQVIPIVRRVELPGVGHLAPDNTGKPERVASELRCFFASRRSMP